MAEKLKKRVCVFCGSRSGTRPEYLASGRDLGRKLAERGYGLVYGGAKIGLMGAVAAAALESGGEVIGVIPGLILDFEVGHDGLTELHVVGTMHERKAMMAKRSDAFVAMPGGFGTLDEFMEILTWAQLRIHAKPCVLVNVGGYYDGLLKFLDTTVREGFLMPENRGMIQVARDVEETLAMIERTWGEREEIPSHDERLDEMVK